MTDKIAAETERAVVKALIWNEPATMNNGCWTADCILGTFSVSFDDGWYACLEDGARWEWEPENDPRSYEGPLAAQAACQAHLETNVLSALTSAPAPAVTEPAEKAVDLERISKSLASMLIEYVDGGINSNQNWRNGLNEIIQARLRRLYAHPAHEEAARLRAEAVAAEREACAVAVEKLAGLLHRKECCGIGITSGFSAPECCADPNYMISDREAAAAIRARPPSEVPMTDKIAAETERADTYADRIKVVATIIASAAEPDGLGDWCGYADAAREIIAALRALPGANPAAQGAMAGWKLIPVEPTGAMCEAGREADEHPGDSYTAVYSAMLSASPPPPEAFPASGWVEAAARTICDTIFGAGHADGSYFYNESKYAAEKLVALAAAPAPAVTDAIPAGATMGDLARLSAMRAPALVSETVAEVEAVAWLQECYGDMRISRPEWAEQGAFPVFRAHPSSEIASLRAELAAANERAVKAETAYAEAQSARNRNAADADRVRRALEYSHMGLDRTHNALLSNGPKQAVGEMVAHFRDSANQALTALQDQDGTDGKGKSRWALRCCDD